MNPGIGASEKGADDVDDEMDARAHIIYQINGQLDYIFTLCQ